MSWQNRILGYDTKPANQFLANPLNWRTHPGIQREALRGLLGDVGWVGAVLENRQTGNLIDGHARIEEALTKDENQLIPYLLVDLSPEEERLVLASFDPISALAKSDKDKLESLLKEVSTSSDSVEKLLSDVAKKNGVVFAQKDAPDAQIDKAAELQEKWRVKKGDLWEIGSQTASDKGHRFLCGDATEKADVWAVCGDSKPLLMVTDPPYGVDYDPHWRDDIVGDFGQRSARGNRAENDEILDWSTAYSLFDGDVAYIWHAGRHASAVQANIERAGFEIRCQIIWAKQHFPISRGHYHWQHEPCWYAVRAGRQAHWLGDRTQTTVWEISSLNPAGRQEERHAHGTQKALECMARPIRNHEGDVYDPFVGSGTTICAAEINKRACYAIEIKPEYCAVTLERLEKMGLSPKLKSDSRYRKRTNGKAA